MLSKFQQKSRLGANTTKTAKNKRKNGMTYSSIIGLMLPEFFILWLRKDMDLKHSLVSITSGLPIPITSNYSTDFNFNNKIRACVSIHSIVDLKVSVRVNSNIPSLL